MKTRKRNLGGRPSKGRTELWLVACLDGTKAAMAKLAVRRSARLDRPLTTVDLLEMILHSDREFVQCFNSVNKSSTEPKAKIGGL